MSVEHYENFPVASVLLPRRLRPAVEAIYQFARTADDIADEGDAQPAARLAGLDAFHCGLDRIEARQPADSPLFAALQEIIEFHDLPLLPFRDLLSAFAQDVSTSSYPDFSTLLDYCRRSANPVGRLMLALYGRQDALSLQQSDAVCSALQLINFLQDVAIDHARGRIYLPQEDLQRFGIDPAQLAQGPVDAKWRALMVFEVARARQLMLDGAPLAPRLPGRIGWELRLVVQGGLRILERIEAADYDVFARRPVLGKRDYALMLARSLRMSAPR
ncbi:MAG: putative phytoene synthase CrtB-like [Paucimonas sp.]|nr:putative phytoene synthase CrtB-like [Paucimonas sp.]